MSECGVRSSVQLQRSSLQPDEDARQECRLRSPTASLVPLTRNNRRSLYAAFVGGRWESSSLGLEPIPTVLVPL